MGNLYGKRDSKHRGVGGGGTVNLLICFIYFQKKNLPLIPVIPRHILHIQIGMKAGYFVVLSLCVNLLYK